MKLIFFLFISSFISAADSLFVNKHTFIKEQCPLVDVMPDWHFSTPQFPLSDYKEKERIIPGAYAVTLENASVCTAYGLVMWNNKLYQDSLWRWSTLYRAPKDIFPLPIATESDETIAVIALQGFSNYYHWMLEILPRLYILKQSKVAYDKLYFPPLQTKFAQTTLQHLGIDITKVIEATNNTHIKPKKLIFPSQPAESQVTPLWVIEFLQDRFLKDYTVKDGKKRIFMSRKNATIRRIINEQTVFELLEPLGFEKVFMEKLSVIEQAELIHESEIIVGIHGAALTNIVFARKGTLIIELFQEHLEKCFFELSHTMNLKYHAIKTKRIPELSQEDVSIRYRNTFIDMAHFEKTFLDIWEQIKNQ